MSNDPNNPRRTCAYHGDCEAADTFAKSTGRARATHVPDLGIDRGQTSAVPDAEIDKIAQGEWERIRDPATNPLWDGLLEEQRQQDRDHVRRIAERVIGILRREGA